MGFETLGLVAKLKNNKVLVQSLDDLHLLSFQAPTDLEKLMAAKRLVTDPIPKFSFTNHIVALTLSSDQKYMATGSLDGTVTLWLMSSEVGFSILLLSSFH